MLLTTTIILFSLVIVNLLLLKFSCNKIAKKVKRDRKPIVLKSHNILLSYDENLAPTGS